uniref:Zinc ribbon domain-containing protein n=1 Tax=Pinguiococcus pyrenoidosus TaxID=172671 RepID=A0A7R9U8L0_9STRA
MARVSLRLVCLALAVLGSCGLDGAQNAFAASRRRNPISRKRQKLKKSSSTWPTEPFGASSRCSSVAFALSGAMASCSGGHGVLRTLVSGGSLEPASAEVMDEPHHPDVKLDDPAFFYLASAAIIAAFVGLKHGNPSSDSLLMLVLDCLAVGAFSLIGMHPDAKHGVATAVGAVPELAISLLGGFGRELFLGSPVRILQTVDTRVPMVVSDTEDFYGGGGAEEGRKFCIACGYHLPRHSIFCSECGQKQV